MVLHKFGDFLYANLEAQLSEHLVVVTDALFSDVARTDVNFIASVNKAWSTWCDQLMLIRNLFMAMDRKFTISTIGTKAIWYAFAWFSLYV
jgi:cullin-4